MRLTHHVKHLWLFLCLVPCAHTGECLSQPALHLTLLPLLSVQFLKLRRDLLKVYEGFCPIVVNSTMLFLVPVFLIKITQANTA